MATKYSTLTLEEEPRVERSRAKAFVLVGLAVVAIAGVATFGLSGQRVNGAVDAVFTIEAGSVAKCDATADGFLNDLPKYDPIFANTAKDLGQACYHSFRCCSTGESGCGQGVDQDLYNQCSSCMKNHPAKSVDARCRRFAQAKISLKDGEELLCKKPYDSKSNGNDSRCANFAEETDKDGNLVFTVAKLKAGAVPNPKSKFFKAEFAGLENCWVPDGAGNSNKFANLCFELLGYCSENGVCPESADTDVGSANCKNCIATSASLVQLSRTANVRQAFKDAIKRLIELRKEQKAQKKLDEERKAREKLIKGKKAIKGKKENA